MRRFALPALLLSGVLIPAPLAAATLAPAVQKDLQCFILFAIGVDQAGKANDQKVQHTAGLGLIYYLGKLTVEAPTLILADAIRQEAVSMTGNPKTKGIGESCDQEFRKAGLQLQNLGQELKGKPEANPSK
jgi:hypothetical protein